MQRPFLALGLFLLLGGGVLGYVALDGDEARLSEAQSTGREPVFTQPRPETIPTVNIADIVPWGAQDAPVPAQGLTVTRFAEGLAHPRSMLRLPNGDILVAETGAPPSNEGGGVVGFITRHLMKKAGAGAPSANRITLLRDADGDGRAEVKSVLLSGLNSPYGMALVGKTLYVANVDALLAFPYEAGATRITAPGRKIVRLPHDPPGHWTRSLIASPDGDLLYVGVGSATNIADNGIEAEANRAAIIEVNPENGDNRVFASGLRNPVGMDWHPVTGDLWTVVNERDMLGSDLVPDYLTRVEFGAFYGWPWNYWGGYEDKRVQPARPEIREYTKRPDYALGNHVAPLGLYFARGVKLGAPFETGAFVGLHGSWNRIPASGYKVAFVPFGKDNRPVGAMRDVLNGFMDAHGKVRGRPVDVNSDAGGALLVTDDVGGIIWRVSRK